MNDLIKILSEIIVQKVMNSGDYNENKNYVEHKLIRFRNSILKENNIGDGQGEQRRDAVQDVNRELSACCPEDYFTPPERIQEE